MSPLQPPISFPSVNTKSFKIPRAKKPALCVKKQVGQMWREALAVDVTGQWCMLETRVRVSRPSVRPLLQYEEWLVTGGAGDMAVWSRTDVQCKVREPRVRLGARTRDPLGLGTQETGADTVPRPLVPAVWPVEELGGVGTIEEDQWMEDNSLDLSKQSVVTHIQSPTHTMLGQFSDSEEEVRTDTEHGQTHPAVDRTDLTLQGPVNTEVLSSLHHHSPGHTSALATAASSLTAPLPSTSDSTMEQNTSTSLSSLISKKRIRLRLEL